MDANNVLDEWREVPEGVDCSDVATAASNICSGCVSRLMAAQLTQVAND